jgi:hypothetical protein
MSKIRPFITDKSRLIKNNYRLNNKMDTESEEYLMGCFKSLCGSLIEDPAFKQAFAAAGIKRNIFRLSVHAFMIYVTNIIHS